MTAPLDLLWEQYRSLGAAQPADFEAFLVAEVERLGQERDAARNALAMIEGADLGEIDVKLIARQARALHSRAPAAPPDEIAHGLRGLDAELDEERAENKRLRGALAPFAALLDPEEDWGAITIAEVGVRIEDVRRARDLLHGQQKAPPGGGAGGAG